MKSSVWWGNFTFKIGQRRYWQLAQCSLYIERSTHQWQIVQQYSAESAENNLVIGAEASKEFAFDTTHCNHFNFEHTPADLTLIPILADRPQVSRPELPFYVAAFERVAIYISSPAWIRITTGDPSRRLQEIATLRQSDTWFGENTQQGELCYASRTRCRMHLEESSLQPLRVITQVFIENRSNENFLVQRIKLPLPYLSIFAGENGHLWTETLVIEKTAGMITRIDNALPPLAGAVTVMSGPRVSVKSNRVLDIFSEIL